MTTRIQFCIANDKLKRRNREGANADVSFKLYFVVELFRNNFRNQLSSEFSDLFYEPIDPYMSEHTKLFYRQTVFSPGWQVTRVASTEY